MSSVANGSSVTLEDRIAVLVAGKDFENLLRVPVAQNVMQEVDPFN